MADTIPASGASALTSQLVRVFPAVIGGQNLLACDARELHAFLEVGRVFAAWITERIEKYGFAEHHDFAVLSGSGRNPSGGRPAKDYHLTLDMAKELAMVENNAKGREARRYFIEMERRALRLEAAPAVPEPPARRQIRSVDDLSFTSRDEAGAIVWWDVTPWATVTSWHDGVRVGAELFGEVRELAARDPETAERAIQFVVATGFSGRGSGIECGFAEALAAAAVRGIFHVDQDAPKRLANPQRKRLPGPPDGQAPAREAPPQALDSLLTLGAVTAMIGVAPSTVYRRMRAGTMPRPVKISDGCVRWRARDIAPLLPDPPVEDSLF